MDVFKSHTELGQTMNLIITVLRSRGQRGRDRERGDQNGV